MSVELIGSDGQTVAVGDNPSGVLDIGYAPGTGLLTPVPGEPGQQGPPGPGIELTGAVATYADLPADLGPDQAGTAYMVQDNGKLYVWSGTAWPAEDAGADFRGEKGDTGRGITDIDIADNDLEFVMSDNTRDTVTVPALADAADAAHAAADSAGTAADSATAAAGSASTAETAATHAATDAATAHTAEQAAQQAATTATAAEHNAKSHAAGAANSATTATTAATDARDHAEAADSAATTATTAATDAGQSAATATTSATNADTSAGAAADSATAAAGSAQEAADVVAAGTPEATATTRGGITLPGTNPGVLGGSWDRPTVAGFADKADLIDGRIPSAQLPAFATVETYVVDTEAQRLALNCEQGDKAIQLLNPGRGTYILRGSDPSIADDWALMIPPDAPVSSVNGYTGLVTLAKGDLGLDAVDNTADADKPISTATADALASKSDTGHYHDAADITTGTVAAARLPIGTTAGTVAAGTDARLANERTPVDGSVTNTKIAADAGIDLAKLAAGHVRGTAGGFPMTLTVWVGTEAQYNDIGTKDETTIYIRTS